MVIAARIAANVIFNRSPGHYRPFPRQHGPAHGTQVCFRNMTGSVVTVWFPGNFLLARPGGRERRDALFRDQPGGSAGTYPYAARSPRRASSWRVTPADIIIDASDPAPCVPSGSLSAAACPTGCGARAGRAGSRA